MRETETDYPPPEEWNAGLHEVVPPKLDDPPFRIGLKRVPHGEKKHPVLLVHGASASSRTFEVPEGGLARYLSKQWDVWMLDWRSSGILSPLLIDDSSSRRVLEPERFNLDEAQDDLVCALRHIAQETGYRTDIPVVGHCIGGALVAQTIATGKAADLIGSIVLTTLGLFFNSGIDDWVKGNERFLEEVWWTLTQDRDKSEFFISPWVADANYRHPWPKQLEDAYRLWKLTPLPHNCGNEFCHRACFMFGMPYRSADMMAIHDGRFPHGLWAQFGRMPLATYMHCVQNLRRGWVAKWQGDDSDTSYLDPEPFRNRGITLITGNENQVWHRDSIDRMYEWLRRELRPQPGLIVKKVFPHYGHQDLYWSSKAGEVYQVIGAGLKSTATSVRTVAVQLGSSTRHDATTDVERRGVPASTT
ncbi:MAG TPA: alpha/beta fold hydrolase [Povalibacter sp.]|nr:alpha/beta fold hydrolase [Povalibacter sp.]